jgi:hypothetical protein
VKSSHLSANSCSEIHNLLNPAQKGGGMPVAPVPVVHTGISVKTRSFDCWKGRSSSQVEPTELKRYLRALFQYCDRSNWKELTGMPHKVISCAVALVLLSAHFSIISYAQSGAPQMQPPLTPAAAKIALKVDQLGVGHTVTVIMNNSREYYGAISGIDSRGFQIAEVDQKQTLNLDYSDVKKIRKGYGGRNLITGKRANPNNSWIGLAVLGGLLAVLVGVAANTD